MPGTSLASIDALLSAAADYGSWNICWCDHMSGNSTAATATCGGLSCGRFPDTITVPTVTAPVTGVVFPTCRACSSGIDGILVGLEFKLGHLVIGTGFTQDVVMPSRWVKGSTVPLAASLLFAVCDTAITGTSTLNVTYTNQSGITGHTIQAMVLPNNAAINSAYLVAPHLASQDTAMRAVTGMGNGGASAGTISIRGLLPLGIALNNGGTFALCGNIDPLMNSMVPWIANAGDTIAVYQFGATTQNDVCVHLVGIGDV